MQTISEISSLRQAIMSYRREGKRIGFVATMGFLHNGHLALVAAAKAVCDIVIVSIFVNPLQFGPTEDLEKYPRNLERDTELLTGAGCHILFTPTVEEMYPTSPPLITIAVSELDQELCGRSRPGHFAGVATVVTKLFNIVQPDVAFFGQKDGQQVAVIRQLVLDLNLPIEIIAVPTVRESDGLALSSRNVYLTAEDRQHALVLNRSLRQAKDAIDQGERMVAQVLSKIKSVISAEAGVNLDYAEVVDAKTLLPVTEIEHPIMIALAAYVGKARLIDNIVIDVHATSRPANTASKAGHS